jgi:16S rRNA (guanine966-N2)-methyltransferase
MRIISGTAGRRKINVPKADARPSTDRLREALFSILSGRVEGARVLDLFAGSGSLGLESLSRGARACDFVDENKESVRVIRKNLSELGLENGRVTESDVMRFLHGQNGQYDLIFADPPYFRSLPDRDFVKELLFHESLPTCLAEDGLLIVEDPPRNNRSAESFPGWNLLDQRRYGTCGILFYQRA